MAKSRTLSTPIEAAPPAHTFPSVSDTLPLKAALDALRRRKFAIIGTVALGLAASVGLWLSMAPRYTSTASVLVNPREIRLFASTAGPDNESLADDHLADDALKVLDSRSNIEKTIVALGLAGDLEFNPSLATPTQFPLLHSLFKRQATPAADQEAVFQHVRDRLRVRRDAESNLLTVTFTSTDPDKAARIANGIVDEYIAGDVQQKKTLMARAQQSIDGELADLRSKVEAADRAVERYRASHHLTDTTNDNLAARNLARLKADLVTAHADAIAKEARMQEIRELRAKGQNYKPVTELASSPIIADLLQRQDDALKDEARLTTIYGDRNPQVIAAKAQVNAISHKLDSEVDNIIRNFQSEAMMAEARERSISQAIESATRQFAIDGNAAVMLRQLEQEARSDRAVYDATLVRLQQIKAETSVLEPDARLISPAVATDRPSFPRLGILVVVGTIVSIVLGSILAALREHFDGRLRSGRQIEARLGIPNLGLTPRIRNLRRHGTVCQYVLDNPLSAYADAVKTIFMRLQWSSATTPQVLLIASPFPGEGKTTLAMSVAALLARSGKRTVLVDADLRSAGIARMLGIAADCGLADVLAGDCALDEACHPYPHEERLHILPAGHACGPVRLIEPRTMESLVSNLRMKYDFIILDSPPVLGFTDSSVMAAVADAVVFVVQWEKTRDAVAASGLEALTKVGASISGVALTQVNLRRHRKYGYGDVGPYYGHYTASYEN